MISWQYLPTELHHEIIKWVNAVSDRSTLANVCLVSSQFNNLAQPFLLAEIYLGPFTSQLRKRPAQLKALSAGGARASTFARLLTIDYSTSFTPDAGKVLTSLETAMLRHLKSAIMSFENVEKVVWNIGVNDPVWVLSHISDALSPSSTLKELVVLCPPGLYHQFKIHTFSNLTKICFEWYSRVTFQEEALGQLLSRCPALTHLELNITCHLKTLFSFTKQALLLEHLSLNRLHVDPTYLPSYAQHLRSLKFFGLCLNNCLIDADETKLWTFFREEQIHLSGVLIDNQSEPFLDYLESFNGLKTVQLIPDHLRFPAPHRPRFLDRLFQALGSHHGQSLLELDLRYTYFWWPSGEEANHSLSLLVNLSRFSTVLFPGRLQDNMHPLISTCSESFPKLRQLVIDTSYHFLPYEIYFPHHRRTNYRCPTVLIPNRVVSEYPVDDVSKHRFLIQHQDVTYRVREDEDTGRSKFVVFH